MPLRSHPLWLVGFRPFFALACLAGMSLPVLWTLVFSGTVTLPGSLPALRWHAHEMFYGFGWAVLGGFLLTATKNWVQVRGYHGPALQLLVAAWLLERITLWWGSGWPPALFLAGANLFLGLIVAMLAATLIRHRRRDSYRDNYFFLLVLPAFIVAKNLLLTEAGFALGWSMTLGLFRMAFLVMLERTLTPFMKGAFQVDLLRYRPLDMSIKFLGLALVLEAAMPTTAAAAIALLLAALMAARLCWWHPHRALRRLDIGIMYLGYLALVGQLLLDAWEKLAGTPWVGTLPLHVFTFGAMGLVIPAMILRIAKGHTGRKVVFAPGDKAVLWIMIAAFAIRTAAPQLWPAAYLRWIELAAVAWFAAFALLAWRTLPFLLQPRVDGKEH